MPRRQKKSASAISKRSCKQFSNWTAIAAPRFSRSARIWKPSRYMRTTVCKRPNNNSSGWLRIRSPQTNHDLRRKPKTRMTMKARYYPALVAAALVCNLQPACSQETVEAPAPPPPGHPAIAPLPPFDPLDHLENVGKHLLRIPRMIHDELRPLDHIKMLLAQVPTPPGAPQIDPVAIAHGAIASGGDFLPFKWSGSSKAGRALLIPKDDADPEAFANAEEDLNIMALILEKAVAQQSDDDHKKVMGIDMLFGGNSS